MVRTLIFVVFAAVLAFLSGCGGGGGGAAGGGTFLIAAGQYIEFIRSGGSWFDPFNLVVGDSGQAVLANYDALGNRTALVASNWGTTAGGGFVNINSSTGFFQVLSAPAGEFKFQTTATIAGSPTLFEQRARVPSAIPSVSGRVVEQNIFNGLPTGTGIPHVDVDFYDAGGTIVGSARCLEDGRFTGRVPLTATHVMPSGDSIRLSKYYRSIYYQTKTYSPYDTTCRIALPGLVNGPNTLPAPIAVPPSSGSPPPPPTGCT